MALPRPSRRPVRIRRLDSRSRHRRIKPERSRPPTSRSRALASAQRSRQVPARDRKLRPPTVERSTGEEMARTPRPVPPRSSSTVVLAGESLADVAVRVYGLTESVEALWRANRDLLTRVDSPLPRGTLLRTP